MNSGQLEGLVVVILTQKNSFHVAQTETRLLDIEADLQTLGVVSIYVMCAMYVYVRVCGCV